jgi:PilZ domain
MPSAVASKLSVSQRSLPASPASAPPVPQIEADRRRHVRFEVNLLGRFMRADKQEFPCRITSISVGDASFMSPTTVEMDERIVAYMDQIGGIEGTVTRVEGELFVLRISATQHKREKLAGHITWLINRGELEGMDARRSGHERLAIGNKGSILHLGADHAVEVSIIDVSISGASVQIADRPPLGTPVTLGKLRALVVRHHADGIGLQFLDIQNPEALRRSFG